MLSVYSSDLPTSGFLIPRTVDATAIIFTEPDITIPRTSISRKAMYEDSIPDRACDRPKIHLGKNNSRPKKKDSPLIDRVSKKLETVKTKIGSIKMRIYDRLRIGCLIPKLIRPFEPTFEYIRCKLGLEEEEFLEAAQCNSIACEKSLEEKIITNDRGPSPMRRMNLQEQTLSDCFDDIPKVQYGARVLAKIVRDKSCDDPDYQQICQELMNEGRVLDQEKCQNSECVNKFSLTRFI